MIQSRRFPPPRSAQEPDPKLDRQCLIVCDAIRYGLRVELAERFLKNLQQSVVNVIDEG